MRALTLTQPRAELVVLGAKRIETRSWQTHIRGQVAIHAASRFPPAERALCNEEPFRGALRASGGRAVYRSPPPATWIACPHYTYRGGLPVGAIVGVATIEGIAHTDWLQRERFTTLPGGYWELTEQEEAFGDYADGRFAWFLSGARILETPIPCKGALSMWVVPAAVETEIRRQLEVAA